MIRHVTTCKTGRPAPYSHASLFLQRLQLHVLLAPIKLKGVIMAGWNLASTLLVVCVLTPRAILGQDAGDMWMGFANTFGSLLDFTCPNNSVVTGIASDFR